MKVPYSRNTVNLNTFPFIKASTLIEYNMHTHTNNVAEVHNYNLILNILKRFERQKFAHKI